MAGSAPTWRSSSRIGCRKTWPRCCEDAGLDGTVAVQARQTLEETQWLLDLADRHEFIKGVVGWVDLCAPRPAGATGAL